MRIWDQELLNQKRGIVTDGLTFWIDGQDSVLTDENGTFLYDRVSAGYVNANPYRCVISNSGSHYIVNRNQVNGTMSIAKNASYKDVKTYEVVFQQGSTNQSRIWFGGTTVSTSSSSWNPCLLQRHSMGIKTSGYGDSTYGSTLTYPSAQITMFVLTFRFNDNGTFDVFLNGTNILHETGGKRGTTTPSYMFAIISPSSGATGVTNLGAYRLYNRALTDKEILQNLKYETSIRREIL